MSPTKTNAMRRLEALGIPYETYTFSSTIHSAQGVAEALGVPLQQVYKTLVVMLPQEEPALVLVPGDRELDLARLAQELEVKKVRMATQEEAEAITGLQVGGISPLALLDRNIPVLLDRPAIEQERIFLSAGARGINLRLSVADLIALTEAHLVEASGV